MAETTKTYLDLEGLQHLVEKTEEREDAKLASNLREAKEYTDSLADNYDAAGTAQTKVNELASGTVKANTDAITKLNADESTEGSVKKQIKTVKDELVSAIETAKTEATYDDTQVKADIKANADDIDTLQTQIGGLTGAMHFRGSVESVPADGASGYASGDVVVVVSSHKEYVYDGTTWHELGDEGSHITKTEVSSTYETKTDSSAKLTAAKSYADSLATNYDAVGSATTAETNAKKYADGLNTTMTSKVDALEEKVDGITAISTSEIDSLFS